MNLREMSTPIVYEKFMDSFLFLFIIYNCSQEQDVFVHQLNSQKYISFYTHSKKILFLIIQPLKKKINSTNIFLNIKNIKPDPIKIIHPMPTRLKAVQTCKGLSSKYKNNSSHKIFCKNI